MPARSVVEIITSTNPNGFRGVNWTASERKNASAEERLNFSKMGFHKVFLHGYNLLVLVTIAIAPSFKRMAFFDTV
jgi:hypothetical protein